MTIHDNSIYIVPNNIKIDLLLDLSKEKKLKNIKFFSLEEIVNSYSSYDEEALYYLMKKYGYKYKNAKIILNNIRYVEDKEYDNEKINNLVKIKNELKDYHVFDKELFDVLKKNNVYVYGYDYIDSYSKRILDMISAKIIEKEKSDYKHTIYGFDTMFDEVSFIASKVRDLINDGIDINKIKLVNYSEEYFFLIKTIFDMHGININLKSDSIYSTNICQQFLKTNSFEDINLKMIENIDVYNKIVSVINKYNFIEEESIKKEIYINEFKNIKINKKYNDSVELKNLVDIKEDEYAFLIGFNEGSVPILYKDEDYLSDREKEILGLDKSYEISSIVRNNTIKNIKSIKNLIISYKLKSSFNEYGKSNLIDDLDFEEVSDFKYNYSYSNSFNNLLLGLDLDNYVKYLDYNDELELLFNNYKTNSYNVFDNSYKKISKDKLYKFLNNKITLSYSSIDNYYKCKFRYYLNNILKIDKYEETFATFIGSLFHYVLSLAFEDNFDFEKAYSEYLIDKELTIKEKFFVDKLKSDLLFIIDSIKKQYSHSNFKSALYENKFSINKDSNIKVDFIGFIDKLLYKEHNGKTLLVIIDYKTGNQELKLNNSIYGLNLQLPVYLYLSKNGEIKNAEVIGMYLQKILNNEITRDYKKTYEKQKEDLLKLNGYSLNKEEYINEFDDTYQNSEVIKSLGTTKDGFKKTAKILTKEQMDELYELVDKKIDEARDGILNADFDIDPKRIGFDNVSCEYCKFKDICFMKEENVKILEEVKDLNFLGGDLNA
ncbi:MAG: PD-(D/E)XK nuclease family protein [Bacilli bacterium]|nr:PD-(D/E)XK nuclease family protein [Bacilli bacterium]